MAHSVVVPVIHRPDYAVAYEHSDGYTYVHVRFRNYNAAVARQFRRDIDAAQELLGESVFVVHDPDRPNLPKFLRLHGFEECGTVIDTRGRTVPLFIRHFHDGRFNHHAE